MSQVIVPLALDLCGGCRGEYVQSGQKRVWARQDGTLRFSEHPQIPRNIRYNSRLQAKGLEKSPTRRSGGPGGSLTGAPLTALCMDGRSN